MIDDSSSLSAPPGSALRCPICGAGASVVYRGHPGYQEPDVFDIARCGECDTSFVEPRDRATSALYDAIYGQVNRIPGYHNYARWARGAKEAADPLDYLAAQEPTYWAVREYLRSEGVRTDARILEIGSGLGYLTYALVRRGYHARGLDISEKAVSGAAKRYGAFYLCADLFEYAAEAKGSCDVVVATEVIEHVPDVYPFVRAALELLRPGGELLLTTPNRNACAPEVVWEVEAPPVHLWWFSASSFEAMGRELGCDVAFVDFAAHPAAKSWRTLTVPGSPRPTKLPVLDRRGRVIPPPVPLATRILGALRRRIATVVGRGGASPTPPPRPGPAGPSPTICVRLRKRG